MPRDGINVILGRLSRYLFYSFGCLGLCGSVFLMYSCLSLSYLWRLPLLALLLGGYLESLVRLFFFRQNRPGLHGVVFEMIKFRSMKNAVDRNGEPLPDSERLTPFGEKLRSLSLDELPGLWNVIKGDMSLVGPRPLLAEYLPRYSKEQRRRHDIRPGGLRAGRR